MFRKCNKLSKAINIKVNNFIVVVVVVAVLLLSISHSVNGAAGQILNNEKPQSAADSEISLNETIVRDGVSGALPAFASQRVSTEAALPTSAALMPAFEVFEKERYVGRGQASGRSYVCVPLLRIFNVELQQRLRPTEFVAVSGDHAALGQWQIAKSLNLHAKNAARTRWALRRWICAKQRIYYRYLIYERNAYDEKVLRQWEGQQTPRMLQTYEIYRRPGGDVFGAAWSQNIGGGVQREPGWLRHEYVIELKFIWRRHIHWRDEGAVGGATGRYLLRLEQLRRRAESAFNDAVIEVSRYAYNRSALREQSARGVRYTEGSVVIFRLTQPLEARNAFKLLIADVNDERLGEVYILPLYLRGNSRILQLPIHSAVNGYTIGELTLPFLLVKPLPISHAMTLYASFQHYWPMNWPTMDVGHRGTGASYCYAGATHVENTIASFLAAHKAKADMVELDVQLTRDYVPIIWHGFGFYTARQDQLVSDPLELSYVLIKDLSYDELKAARVFVTKRWRLQEYTHLNVRNATFAPRIFPTLTEVYATLPKTLGLLIEIKWPQLMESGVMESTQPLNKNRYVNEILAITAKHGCGRPLIFTSFDADICTMVRLKQPAFPAMLMTTGKTHIWDPYMDLRTQSFLQAVNFAESADILGTATHVENFYGRYHLVDLGLELMQAVFIWGNDLKQQELHEQFRYMEVSGLIYDQIARNGPNWKRASFFGANELVEIFGKQCVVIGNSTTIPGVKPPKPTIWPKL